MQDQSSKSITTIPARVFDAARRMRWLAFVGATMLALGIALAFAVPWAGFGLSIGGVVTLLAWDLRLRRRPRDRVLVCKAGSIRAPGTGLIRARDLEGATTARVGERVALVLAHRRRRRTPIILELADDAALDTICKSLGIGHHGFGHVDFITRSTSATRSQRIFAALGIVSVLAMLIPVTEVIALAAMMFVVALTVIVSVAFARLASPPPFIRLTSGGLFLPNTMFVPFHVIEEVSLLADAISFSIRTDRGVVPLMVSVRDVTLEREGATREELEHMVAQIRAASDRAHGKVALKSQPETLAAQLAHGKDESAADWHARLDTLGLGGSGYRALSVEPAELWTLFEDPDATADVRAGAARVLRRLDKDALEIRVAGVLATVRDEQTRTRIAESIEEEEDAPVDSSQSAAHS
jgi:hypothetical protein